MEKQVEVKVKKVKGVKVAGEGPQLRGLGSEYPLAVILREVIRTSGLAQNEVAERAQVDRGVINRLIKGTRDVNGATIDQLFRVFGIELLVKNPTGEIPDPH